MAKQKEIFDERYHEARNSNSSIRADVESDLKVVKANSAFLGKLVPVIDEMYTRRANLNVAEDNIGVAVEASTEISQAANRLAKSLQQQKENNEIIESHERTNKIGKYNPDWTGDGPM